mmetsp:Transcript_101596/g.286499  ORF Transcript_101596/g.286499 Transcript_101596/m.286499 type:complete len:217 (+) Transcript_101596:658-1308(+)
MKAFCTCNRDRIGDWPSMGIADIGGACWHCGEGIVVVTMRGGGSNGTGGPKVAGGAPSWPAGGDTTDVDPVWTGVRSPNSTLPAMGIQVGMVVVAMAPLSPPPPKRIADVLLLRWSLHGAIDAHAGLGDKAVVKRKQFGGCKRAEGDDASDCEVTGRTCGCCWQCCRWRPWARCPLGGSPVFAWPANPWVAARRRSMGVTTAAVDVGGTGDVVGAT